MMIDPTVIVQKLQLHLPDLLAIYVFGSYAQGTHGSQSDLDLAVLVPGLVAPLILFDLGGHVADLTGCSVDLVDLRAASTVLQYQIINGICWWSSDSQAALYESVILSEKTELDTARAAVLNDIQHRGRIYG